MLRRRVSDLEKEAARYKGVEKALGESGTRLQSIFRAAPVGIGLVSQERVLLEANDRLCKMLGYLQEELVGKSARILYPSDEDYEFVGREKYRQIREQGTGSVETRWRRKDGEIIEVLLSSTPLDPSDPSYGVTFTALDITERKRAEEGLRRERDRAHLYLDIAGVMLLALDSEVRVTMVNRKGCEILGYGGEEIRGKKWVDNFVPERMREEVKEIFAGIMAGRLEQYEYVDNPVLCSNGEEKIIAWHNTVFTDEDGRIIGTLSSGEDITELRRTHILMEKLNRLFLSLGPDLLENVERIVQGAKDILECDYAAFCLLTRERLSILSSAPGEEGFVVSEEPAAYICHDIIAGNEKEPVAIEELEGTFYAQSDPVIARHGFRSYLGYPVIVEGRTVGCLSVFDLGGREWSDEEVETAGMLAQSLSVEQERLDREEDLKDFIDVASHELRHPITIIKGYARTLRDLWGRLNEEKREELLDAVEHGADRLNRLVKELLDVSRIERGYFPVSKERTALRPLLEGAVSELANRGFMNRLNITGADEDDMIYADPDRIATLLSILIDNAAKYSGPGSEIDIEVGWDESGATISVLDRGIGVPGEDRERIFNRFYQVEDALHHSTPGMGVGLYVAREIIGAHGGRIWYEPREGGGSAFRFTIPGT